jgi:YVTN family beta-propeller protein
VLGAAAATVLVAGVALLGAPAAVASGGASPYTTLSVAIPAAPSGLAVDEATDKIYVANACGNGDCSSAGTVAVIDGATDTVTATVTVGFLPYGVAVDEATGYKADTVLVIDGATNTVTATVAVGRQPYGIAVNETTNTVYLANGNSDFLSVIVPSSLDVPPPSGLPGTSVTVSGRGFNPGETVKVTYKTGLASPASVTLCTVTAGSDTTYTCSGSIPSTATAGATGSHEIAAKGQTSGIKVKTAFTLT